MNPADPSDPLPPDRARPEPTAPNQPAANQPAPEQPAPEQPAPEPPAAEQPAPEPPAPEPPVTPAAPVSAERPLAAPWPEPQPDPSGDRWEENPYAAPLEGKWVEESARGTIAGSELRAPVAPWSGGWGLMVLFVAVICGLGLALAFQSENGWIAGLFAPVLGLGMIAVLVRVLHSSVDVEWPIYLLISAGFGVVSYFAFIPVCIVVSIPIMFVLEAVSPSLTAGAIVGAVAVFTIVLICGLIFTALLRLYMKHRYRKQWFAELAALHPPASEPIVPGDPFAAPRERSP